MAMQMLADWSFVGNIPVRDIDGTRKFYESVLGLEIVMEDPAGITYRSGDTFLALYPTDLGGTASTRWGRSW